MLAPSPQNIIDPFYPDGYASSDQDRAQIAAQKAKYAPSVGSVNFKFPLKSYKQGFFQGNQTTKSAVREDIKVLLMTVKGERLMDKNMGTNIPVLAGQLFEPMHKVELSEKIKLEVTTAIEIYLPFLSIQNVSVITSDDDSNLTVNQIRVSMSYLIKDQQAMSDSVSFTVTSV
jgi:phage baseplate assembly protein W